MSGHDQYKTTDSAALQKISNLFKTTPARFNFPYFGTMSYRFDTPAEPLFWHLTFWSDSKPVGEINLTEDGQVYNKKGVFYISDADSTGVIKKLEEIFVITTRP